jgi:hypothetical protein
MARWRDGGLALPRPRQQDDQLAMGILLPGFLMDESPGQLNAMVPGALLETRVNLRS